MPTVAIAIALSGCSDGTGPSAEGVRFQALVPDGSGSLVVRRYNGSVGRRISPDSLPFVLDFAEAPDGRMAYVTMLTANQHRAIAEYAPDGAPLRVVDVGFGAHASPRDIAYSPDGSRLAWVASREADDSLFVLDAGSRTPRAVARRVFREGVGLMGEIFAAVMRWTPQGEIVFGPPRALVAVDPVTGASRQIVGDAGAIFDYDFASDGRLAMASVDVGASATRLRAQRVIGGPLVDMLPGPSTMARSVRWSPDGTRLATIGPDTTYDGTNGGTTEGVVETTRLLQILRLDGGPPVRNKGVWVADIAGWSRDGGVLVTGLVRGEGAVQVDAILAYGTGRPRNLTRTPGVEERIVKLRR